MYACPIRDIAYFRLSDNFDMMSVFQFMAAMTAEFSAFITSYPFIYSLVGYIFRFCGKVSGNLPGGTSLPSLRDARPLSKCWGLYSCFSAYALYGFLHFPGRFANCSDPGVLNYVLSRALLWRDELLFAEQWLYGFYLLVIPDRLHIFAHGLNDYSALQHKIN